jgi:DNA-binding XRE family transcriptional regulator
MEINQKKELAKLLYLTERSITQQELADRTGVSRRSIGKWIKERENLKLNLLQTREERINSTLMQLDELDNTIQEKPEGMRFPNKEESLIRRKLTEDLAALEQDASIRDIYNVSRRILDWIRPRDLDKAKELSNYFDAYIKEQMQWVK